MPGESSVPGTGSVPGPPSDAGPVVGVSAAAWPPKSEVPAPSSFRTTSVSGLPAASSTSVTAARTAAKNARTVTTSRR
nr:hypothetical protein DA06_03230 [Georgenia sp. SUBG003]